jgi:hypothetical protein
MKCPQPGPTSVLSSIVIATIAVAMSFTLLSCSKKSDAAAQNGDPALYGKWQHTKTAMFDSKGAQAMGNVDADGDPHVKVIEFRKDGTYLDGNRPGHFQFVDATHINMSIDGLMGVARIVLQGNTLEVWNPDGSEMDAYKRKD